MKQFFACLVVFIFTISIAFSQVHVDSSGNVGIGISTPTTKLDVNGVINATGGNSTEWNNKQDTLTAGSGIDITNNVISTTGYVIDTITTIDAIATTISNIATSNNTAYIIETHFIGLEQANNEAGGFILQSVWRNDAGILSNIQIPNKLQWAEPASNSWNVEAIISGTNLLINVRGQFGKTINWKASSRITSIN